MKPLKKQFSNPNKTKLQHNGGRTNGAYYHKRIESGHVLRARTHHDDVIKWKHLPHYWPFVGGIHRSPVNSPHKGQWCGALMFSLICTWTNSWTNNGDVDDFKHHRAHYDVTVMHTHTHTHTHTCTFVEAIRITKQTFRNQFGIIVSKTLGCRLRR